MGSHTVTIDEILKTVKDIPPLPAVVPRVMSIINDPNCSVAQLAEVLGADQGIASKLLRLSNSAFYGFSRHIGTIQDAVVLLGFKTIKGLIYALSLYSSFSRDVKGYNLRKGELWRHSLAAAFIARNISERAKAGNPEQAFVAGLMHDIGKTILGEFLENNSAEVLRLVEEEDLQFVNAEKVVLGVSHAEVGARLCEKWNLPEEHVEAVRHHHSPSSVDSSNPLIPIVHLADGVCLMMGIGIGLDGMSYTFDDSALTAIGKDMKFLDDIVDATKTQVTDIENLLHM